MPTLGNLNMDTTETSRSAYHALSKDRGEIRLLHILPAEDESTPIHCTLSTASLEGFDMDTPDMEVIDHHHGSRPRYEALSYAWGTVYHQDSIYIEEQPKLVTVSLYEALQHLRHTARERVMWIDAVCIDQSSLEERSHQVGMMSDIFSRALNTTIWLGKGSDECALAMKMLERMGGDSDLHLNPALTPHVEIEDESLLSTRVVAGMERFFCAPWWSRVWTLQEYVLSRQTTFQCGPFLLDGQVLQNACNVWYRHTNLDLCCRHFTQNHADRQNLYLYQGRLADVVFVRAFFNTLRLPQIIGRFLTRLVTDPRDKIYGMLGLARGIYEKAVVADYSKSTEEVFESVTIQMIQHTGSLEVLSGQPSSSLSLLDLPSWVPDWTVPYDNDLQHGAFKDWVINLHLYNANKDAIATLTVLRPGCIWLNGITVDEIKMCADFDSHLDNLKLVASMYDSATKTGDVNCCVSNFWSTMRGSIKRDADDNGDMYVRQPTDQDCDSALFAKLVAWMVKPIREMLQDGSADADIASFMHVFSCVSAGRRFAITKGGRLAWCPGPCQKGDTVAVLAGGTVPFILRKASNSQHRLLGDAYVHGIMDGEAVEEMYRVGSGWEHITLV